MTNSKIVETEEECSNIYPAATTTTSNKQEKVPF
jgi:hypothetical protein